MAIFFVEIVMGSFPACSIDNVSKSLVLTGDVTDRLAEEVVKTHGSTRAGFIED